MLGLCVFHTLSTSLSGCTMERIPTTLQNSASSSAYLKKTQQLAPNTFYEPENLFPVLEILKQVSSLDSKIAKLEKSFSKTGKNITKALEADGLRLVVPGFREYGCGYPHCGSSLNQLYSRTLSKPVGQAKRKSRSRWRAVKPSTKSQNSKGMSATTAAPSTTERESEILKLLIKANIRMLANVRTDMEGLDISLQQGTVEVLDRILNLERVLEEVLQLLLRQATSEAQRFHSSASEVKAGATPLGASYKVDSADAQNSRCLGVVTKEMDGSGPFIRASPYMPTTTFQPIRSAKPMKQSSTNPVSRQLFVGNAEAPARVDSGSKCATTANNSSQVLYQEVMKEYMDNISQMVNDKLEAWSMVMTNLHQDILAHINQLSKECSHGDPAMLMQVVADAITAQTVELNDSLSQQADFHATTTSTQMASMLQMQQQAVSNTREQITRFHDQVEQVLAQHRAQPPNSNSSQNPPSAADLQPLTSALAANHQEAMQVLRQVAAAAEGQATKQQVAALVTPKQMKDQLDQFAGKLATSEQVARLEVQIQGARKQLNAVCEQQQKLAELQKANGEVVQRLERLMQRTG